MKEEKVVEKCSNWRSKSAENGRAEMKATGQLMLQFWGLHSPVMRSRHQEN